MLYQARRRESSTAVTMVSYLLAAVFILSGLAKLWGAQLVQEQFAAWNYPPSLMYTVGVVEVVAGLLLVTASARAIGAMLLGIMMIGAAATHFFAQEWGAIAVPMVVLGLLSWIALRSPIQFVTQPDHGAPRVSR